MQSSDSNQLTHIAVAADDGSAKTAILDRLQTRGNFIVRAPADWEGLATVLQEQWCESLLVGPFAGASPLEIIQRVKSRYPSPPAMIMVGEPNLPTVLKAFRCGFFDFVRSDVPNNLELIDAVERSAAQSLRERRQQYRIALLESEARRDSVTGLPKFPFVEERMNALIRAAAKRPLRFAILVLAVEQMDELRGTFGHRVSDRVHYEFAKRLKLAARSSDTLARLDENWFILLVDREAMARSLEGARQRLASSVATELEIDAVGVAINAKIGVAAFDEHGSTVDELVESAKSNAVPATSLSPEPGDATRGHKSPGAGEAAPPGNGGRVEAVSPVASASENSAVADAPPRTRERRRTPRQRTYRGGILVLGGGSGTIRCIIRDLSTGGARVEIEGHFTVPKDLELLIPETNQRLTAEIRWHRGQQIGLQFTELTH